MEKVKPEVPQKQVEIELLVDQVCIHGEFHFKDKTPTITVASWLADSMVTQGVAKLKGVK